MPLELLRNGRGTKPLLLLHGFGATAEDLYPIGELPQAAAFYGLYPRAPKQITVSGQNIGRAWFPREDTELSQALFGSYFSSLESLDPPGLVESGREVYELLESEAVRFEHLVVGGFSQGAMVAIEAALALARNNRPPAALLLFSGALIAGERWRGELSLLRGVPVFQSHGTADPILDPKQGAALGEALDEAGCRRVFYEFDGTHTIPQTAIDRAFSMLV
ncbi:MAG: alpha/beta hydrolase [Spirochaetales bacterium]